MLAHTSSWVTSTEKRCPAETNSPIVPTAVQISSWQMPSCRVFPSLLARLQSPLTPRRQIRQRPAELGPQLQIAQQQHGDQCRPDLRAHGVAAGAHKGLNAQVLLQCLEEQFHLPAVPVDRRHRRRPCSGSSISTRRNKYSLLSRGARATETPRPRPTHDDAPVDLSGAQRAVRLASVAGNCAIAPVPRASERPQA